MFGNANDGKSDQGRLTETRVGPQRAWVPEASIVRDSGTDCVKYLQEG